MKRLNNLFEKIYDIDNLQLADVIARKGKLHQPGVIDHDKNREDNILKLQEVIKNKTYNTSQYKTFKIHEPKERLIFMLPYFPDRITHHAIMNILKPVFVSNFTADTYSCIEGKGIKAAADAVKSALSDEPNTQYCLKLDIKKFYPSIDHAVLKNLLRKKFKDQDLLWLIDEIIDSTSGIPIGNYLSQYFANFYLSYFDHWIKEVKHVRYYFRYADDIVILSGSKSYLHELLAEIRHYLSHNLKLTVKKNYQVFPISDRGSGRGIDFVGYVFFHTHTRLRKTIKKNFAKMLTRNKNTQSIAAYKGWAKHCNSKHLLKKLLAA